MIKKLVEMEERDGKELIGLIPSRDESGFQ
jgi:hypothetical protein